jgi:two-component system, OmpR family, sensor histidine kinase QseC
MDQTSRPPSLIRKVMMTVGLAWVVANLVLLGVVAWQFFRSEAGEVDRSLVRLSIMLMQAMDHASDNAAAAEAMRVLRRAEQTLTEQEDLQAPTFLVAGRRDASFVLLDPRMPAIDVLSVPDGFSTRTLGGVDYRLHSDRNATWHVVLAHDEARTRSMAMTSLARDMALYSLIAIALMAIPLLRVVRRALVPLQALSMELAARPPLSLAPIGTSMPWRELQPLVAALNSQYERLGRAVATERAFVDHAAHELRTPLAAIAAQGHLLAVSEGPARAEALLRLEHTVQRASHLSHQLLRLARADASGEMIRAGTPTDAMQVIREALSASEPKAHAQRSELSLVGPDTLSQPMDAASLRSIVDNLVINALLYAGHASRITVSIEAVAGQVMMIVADDGPGLPAVDVQHAFQRFWRGQGEAQQAARGAGLGLAIVRQAARAHGGDATIESTASGCTVRVAWQA